MNCRNVDAYNIMSQLLMVPVVSACFNVEMRKLEAYGNIMARMLNREATKLHQHLVRCQYPFQTYIFDSVASLYCANVPYATALKLWEVIIGDPEIGFLRVGLSIFLLLQKTLLKKEVEDIIMIVKFPCQHVTEQELLQQIRKINIAPKDYLKIKQQVMMEAGLS